MLRRKKHTDQKSIINSAEKEQNKGPIALILAGYNKVDPKTKRKEMRELRKAYKDDIIYLGQNKFIQELAEKPVIQYVIDAVTGAKKNNKKLYNKIFVYNDIKSIEEAIDLKKYPDIVLKQMKDSVGGHLKDFCQNFINYGQRVDVFYGDTPRITTADVEWIHGEYDKILGKKKNHNGISVKMAFGIVELEDLNDNWLEHRYKFIKIGKNKGQLKYFVGFENFQARIGNSASFIMDKALDDIIEYQIINFPYNLRKALTPKIISKIIYYFWKYKYFHIVRQIKKRNINEIQGVDAVLDVLGRIFRADILESGFMFYHIHRNAARWENDIDSPKDLNVLDRKFREYLKIK
jgi:hypothetical protein